jgi:hypothetical protein
MTKQPKNIDSSLERFTFLVMSMADTTIPQGGATTPTIPATQDLQINLGENKVLPQNEPQNTETPVLDFDLNLNLPVLDLNLDLDLSDAPKDDNRLQVEDQKNKETTISTTNEVSIQQPIVENTEPITKSNEEQIAPTITPTETLLPEVPVTPSANTEPTIQETITITPTETLLPEVPVTPPANTEPTIQEKTVQTEVSAPIQATEATNKEQPTIEDVFSTSTSIETLPTSSATISPSSEDIIPASASLQEDMKIIDALE